MEFKNIRFRACILFVFCSISSFAVAQTQIDDLELLQGEWTNEGASVFDTERTISLDPGNSFMEIYAEIEIIGDTILLRDHLGEVQKAKYEVNGNYLGFDLHLRESFITEWAIFEDKLYLEFNTFHPFGAPRKVNALLVYKRK